MKTDTTMNAISTGSIPGWGIDADPRNEPTFPMKTYTGADHARLNWPRPPLQSVDVEVLRSIERPHLPAAFGTAVPPSGLSGLIRRMAFRYSENRYAHWLPLLLADRVNVIEGVLGDLVHGRVPNVYKERGWGAEMRHRPVIVTLKVLVRVLILAAIVYGVYRLVRG